MVPKTRSVAVPLVLSLLMVTAPLLIPSSQAAMTTEAEGVLETAGKLMVKGSTKVDGWEANLVRSAIDSTANNPSFGLLGTGNGDGVVNATEAFNYAQKAVTAGLVKTAFQMGFMKAREDGKDIPGTLKAMAFPDASGNVTNGGPLNLTFEVEFVTKFEQDKDTHKFGFSVTFHNISYSLKFKIPAGWDIGTVKGLEDKRIINSDKGSYVRGIGAGDGTMVEVEVKKESEWCCMVVGAIVVIGVLVVVYIMFRRYKKKRDVSMTQPEYVTVSGDGATDVSVVKPPVERRIKKDDRTFGKEYFDKEGQKENVSKEASEPAAAPDGAKDERIEEEGTDDERV